MKPIVNNNNKKNLNAAITVMLPGQSLCLRRMVLVFSFFLLKFFSPLNNLDIPKLTKSIHCGQIKVSVWIVDSDGRKDEE